MNRLGEGMGQGAGVFLGACCLGPLLLGVLLLMGFGGCTALFLGGRNVANSVPQPELPPSPPVLTSPPLPDGGGFSRVPIAPVPPQAPATSNRVAPPPRKHPPKKKAPEDDTAKVPDSIPDAERMYK